MSEQRIKHFASIDLEDWYHDVEKTTPSESSSGREAFLRQIECITQILEKSRTKCTFFALGKTAERFPDWIARLHNDGHEIASHGYGHEKVFGLSPGAFAEDVEKSARIISAITGKRPIGYRAPFFSITREVFWCYQVLSDLGFRYSSSIFPFPGRRYGIEDYPLDRQEIECKNGQKMNEFPLAVISVLGRRFPVAGGGFWRVLPRKAIDAVIGYREQAGVPFTMYLHPHEFDTQRLKSNRGIKRDMYVNLGRASIRSKFRYTVENYAFGPFRDFFADGS